MAAAIPAPSPRVRVPAPAQAPQHQGHQGRGDADGPHRLAGLEERPGRRRPRPAAPRPGRRPGRSCRGSWPRPAPPGRIRASYGGRGRPWPGPGTGPPGRCGWLPPGCCARPATAWPVAWFTTSAWAALGAMHWNLAPCWSRASRANTASRTSAPSTCPQPARRTATFTRDAPWATSRVMSLVAPRYRAGQVSWYDARPPPAPLPGTQRPLGGAGPPAAGRPAVPGLDHLQPHRAAGFPTRSRPAPVRPGGPRGAGLPARCPGRPPGPGSRRRLPRPRPGPGPT